MRYVDDGFMLANKTNLTNIITNLTTSYPSQSPITFTSNQHTVHYLNLALSLNHYTMWYHKVHYQVYQKPHHKHMYPHPKHIFTGIIKAETIRYYRFSAIVDDYNFIMSEVSDYFQLVARTHWTSFHFTYSPLPIHGIIDVDINHMALREDECDMLQRFVHAALGSVQYRINYIPQLRSHGDPNYIHLIHLFDVHFLRRHYIQDRVERVSLRFISHLLFNRFNQAV